MYGLIHSLWYFQLILCPIPVLAKHLSPVASLLLTYWKTCNTKHATECTSTIKLSFKFIYHSFWSSYFRLLIQTCEVKKKQQKKKLLCRNKVYRFSKFIKFGSFKGTICFTTILAGPVEILRGTHSDVLILAFCRCSA